LLCTACEFLTGLQDAQDELDLERVIATETAEATESRSGRIDAINPVVSAASVANFGCGSAALLATF
jgi:hypothetical protein